MNPMPLPLAKTFFITFQNSEGDTRCSIGQNISDIQLGGAWSGGLAGIDTIRRTGGFTRAIDVLGDTVFQFAGHGLPFAFDRAGAVQSFFARGHHG